MHLARAFAVSSCVLLLAGCGDRALTPSTEGATAVRGAALRGMVHGGQQAIVGASVYLYAVGAAGYGNASASLLTSAGNTGLDGNGNYYATTGSDGSFSVTGDYTCPSTASQVYLYAVGGDAGSGSSNPAIGLLAALGTCPASGTLSPSLFVYMNEISTVATAYAMAGYATDATDVSSSGSALAQTGVANAFAAAPNLETLATGVALATTPAGNGSVPQSEIDTLGNILAACINSTGSGSTACTTLLGDALSNGTTGAAPGDTATAAINVAHNPGANVSALFGLQAGTPPFQPMLSGAPSDFTLAVNYSGGGVNSPTYVAVDGAGGVWAANASSISKLGPTGNALSGSGGYTGGGLSSPYNLAIDGLSHVWVSDAGTDSLSEFNLDGTAVTGSSGYTGGGQVANPFGVTVDASNDVWVANSSSLSEFDSSGTLLSTTNPGYTADGIADPYFIAIDTSGNAWATDNASSAVSEVTSSGGTVGSGGHFTNGGLGSPWGIAIDAAGNVWAANAGNSSLSEFNPGGTAVSSSGYTGGGLSSPYGIAIDGAGNVWVANSGGSISEFNNGGTAITSASGYTAAGQLSSAYSVAVDGSGNLWIADAGSNSLYELVGAASPVVTPLAANLISPYAAHAVNKP